MTTLIIGMGNPILKDDAIGLKIVEDIKPKFPKIDFKTLSVGGLSIIEEIQGYETVIFIDSIKTNGGIPGEVYELFIDDFKETMNLSSFHDVHFPVAIEFAKRMNLPIPKNIFVLAIEIVENMVCDDHLSPEILVKYDEIKKKIEDSIKKYINKISYKT